MNTPGECGEILYPVDDGSAFIVSNTTISNVTKIVCIGRGNDINPTLTYSRGVLDGEGMPPTVETEGPEMVSAAITSSANYGQYVCTSAQGTSVRAYITDRKYTL